MDSPKHIKYTHFVAVALFLVLALLPQQHFAQERKVQNRPYIDMRRWHYGFLFGVHSQDLEFVHNGYLHQLEDGTPESWYADVPAYSPGFSVGVLGELYLTQHFALRFIPTMHFGDKQVYLRDQVSGSVVKQTMKSTYLSVPVDVKCAAQRFNNYRPYLVAGVAPMVDLTQKKQKPLMQNATDFFASERISSDARFL